ncbi:hypothetical protein BOTBODRAFT_173213 [Botryobasidium botryosum FD-172 SS1]|uniref:Uncharacterized protein n=1 Tax=Botryobasidium botryosum (strain FD-172 SS1) TaxID=930990 RepID=A0A067MKQ4_BOTB1|nr:hypothetical protein BOTBODRAFT_173213 [Botryobasidium botryosum FD-172 SS1]
MLSHGAQTQVIAPRPLRISSSCFPKPCPRNHESAATLVDPVPQDAECNLPAETLEEFLAILRPSHPLPGASSRRTLRAVSASAAYERPHPYRVSPRERAARNRTGSVSEEEGSGKQALLSSEDEHGLWSPPLESPISRSLTRNPLPRHPSYDTLAKKLVFPPSDAIVIDDAPPLKSAHSAPSLSVTSPPPSPPLRDVEMSTAPNHVEKAFEAMQTS